MNRQDFLRTASVLASTALLPTTWAAPTRKKMFFDISLAEWSLHKALFSKKITNLDFPAIAQKEFGISIVEYVNQFFKDKAQDKTYLNDLLTRCKDHGVSNHLIMVDGEGPMADADEAKRNQTVENHKKWVEAAKYLGCKTIRVNAYGDSRLAAADMARYAADGLHKLGEWAKPMGINIIVENHGGNSSNGEWLAGVMKQVDLKNVGTLPDFGNFHEYDRYKGTTELMPFAKGVSAKTYDFDAQGNCLETDYGRIMKIVKESGFKGIVGIEYEGDKLDEYEGIRHTKALLERVGNLI